MFLYFHFRMYILDVGWKSILEVKYNGTLTNYFEVGDAKDFALYNVSSAMSCDDLHYCICRFFLCQSPFCHDSGTYKAYLMIIIGYFPYSE